jgi:PsbP-like protein
MRGKTQGRGNFPLERIIRLRYHGVRMKSKLSGPLIGVVIIAAIGSVLVAHYDELLPRSWQTYSSPDGTFSIDLPGKTTLETRQAPLEGDGTLAFHTISVASVGNSAYTLAYVEHQNVGEKSPDKALESARDGSLRKAEGTLLTQNRIAVQGFPGLDIQARAKGNTFMDSRIVVVGNRLYMIMAVAASEQDRNPKTLKRIFDSFKLSPK